MLRLLAALVLLLAACDEDDPATSEHCVMVRMQHIEMVFRRNQAVQAGPTAAAVASVLDAGIARFVSANWQCFR